jgi:SAM-dependent methyltransferase
MENYRGLHIGCAPGTHKALADALLNLTDARAGVLDIGAHAGALLARLRDVGFHDLVGVDLDETRFDVPEAEFRKVELNADFADSFQRDFSVVTATDVIEHLDDPRHFIMEVRKLLRPGGLLGLSFPNIAFFEGRVKFMLTGEHWGFGEQNYRAQRHISPMTHDQTRLMLQEIGFDVLLLTTAGSFATLLRKLLLLPLWSPMRAIGGASALGESTIVIARKSEPDASLRQPLHYRRRWNGEADRIGLDA